MLALTAAQRIGCIQSRVAKPLAKPLTECEQSATLRSFTSNRVPQPKPLCINFGALLRARLHQIWCAEFHGKTRCLRIDWVSR